MKKLNAFVVVVVAVVVVVLGLGGCGGNVENNTYLVGEDCQVPESTLLMQKSWAEADTYMRTCTAEADRMWQNCYDHPENWPTGGQEECHNLAMKENNYCAYYYGMRVNKFTLRECGVVVFSNLTDPEMVPAGEQMPPWDVNDNDEDGDGIETWWEYMMGYNPCTPQSFGCVEDAELDYDVDGIANGEDEFPLCNWDDPAGWQGDCI